MRNLFAMRSRVLVGLTLLTALSNVVECQTAAPKEAPANETKGAPPRAAPTDYQTHAKVGPYTVAADFAGHSVPTIEATYSTEDYVVIEVAIYGEPSARLKLSIEDFSLKLNDKKVPLTSQPFGYVARSLKDPEWQPPDQPKEKSKTSLNGGGGGGDNGPVVPPKMPIELRHAMDQRVQKSVLPEGDRALPVAGLLFFSYRGKTQNIKNMELIYDGPAGKASLPLQP